MPKDEWNGFRWNLTYICVKGLKFSKFLLGDFEKKLLFLVDGQHSFLVADICSQMPSYSKWLRSHLSFFYHSKRKFTMVNRFFNVTGFSHFTMVNATLVCCVSNGGGMKAKFTIVKPPQKAWFIARLSKLCLFRLHLVTNFEKHFVT